jgi:cell division protein FtsB
MSSAVPSPTSPAADRRTRPARAVRSARVARETRARRVRLTARASVLAVIVMVLLTLSVAPLRTLLDQRSELANLEQQTQQLTADNATLEQHIAQLNDPAYLERLARECLGMVKPGETAFVLIPRKGPPPSPQC